MRDKRGVIAAGALAAVVAGGALAGCGGTESAFAESPSAESIRAELTEMSIELSASESAAGELTFVVLNEGAVEHELEILRHDGASDGLPVSDGKALVEEEAEVAEVEDVGPGESRELAVSLAPGDYLLICNVPGHYEAGMHTSFRVE